MKTFSTKYFKLLFLLSCFCSISLFSSVQDILQLCDSLDSDINQVKSLSDGVAFRIRNISYGLGDGRNLTYRDIYGMSQALTSLEYIDNNLITMSSEVGQIRAYANSLDNSSGSTNSIVVSTNSTDLTEIITRLDTINSYLSEMANSVVSIDEQLDSFDVWFQDNKDKISNYLDNWGNFTNSLPSSYFYHFVTNSVGLNIKLTTYNGGPHFVRLSNGSISTVSSLLSAVSPWLLPNGTLNFRRFSSLSDYFSLLHYDNQYFGSGIMNTLYTNTVDTISFHRDFQKDFKSYSDFTTNKITEINSIFYNNSPLEDLQVDVNPSNIYNFVTNYYIKVSTDPSGSASENKTNWFNRIEMLLTALVFRPEETVVSNKFDNATDAESESFSDSLKSFLNEDITEVQSKSTDVKEQFEKTKSTLLKFFNHLDDKLSSLASMPSHIEFFEITVNGEKKKVEITTSNSFGKLADVFRSITTLCWISFFVYLIYVLSIWLFHKFSTILKFCYAVFKTLIGIG